MGTIIKGSVKKTGKRKSFSKEETKSEKLFKASEFCGKVKFKKDAMAIQKKLRNEWR